MTFLRPTILIKWRSISVDDAGGVDAADVANLRGGDRLLVGDHRERLERRDRQLLRSTARETAGGPIHEARDAS